MAEQVLQVSAGTPESVVLSTISTLSAFEALVVQADTTLTNLPPTLARSRLDQSVLRHSEDCLFQLLHAIPAIIGAVEEVDELVGTGEVWASFCSHMAEIIPCLHAICLEILDLAITEETSVIRTLSELSRRLGDFENIETRFAGEDLADFGVETATVAKRLRSLAAALRSISVAPLFRQETI